MGGAIQYEKHDYHGRDWFDRFRLCEGFAQERFATVSIDSEPVVRQFDRYRYKDALSGIRDSN
jgi:hypothetical protein